MHLFPRPRRSRAASPRGRHARTGFTLIEILIVISIIGVVASLILVAINKARVQARVAAAKIELSSLSQALDQYVQDESTYPGMELEADSSRNDFPLLFNALFGDRRPKGPGGRSAPYTRLDESKVFVYDNDTGEYRTASRDEIHDAKTEKYIMDGFGNVYWYRANKGKTREDWMIHPESADIYSWGPNGIDDTVEGSEESDDIKN